MFVSEDASVRVPLNSGCQELGGLSSQPQGG